MYRLLVLRALKESADLYGYDEGELVGLVSDKKEVEGFMEIVNSNISRDGYEIYLEEDFEDLYEASSKLHALSKEEGVTIDRNSIV